MKFHENPSGRSRIVPCGQTYMTKLIGAFRYLAQSAQKSQQFTNDSRIKWVEADPSMASKKVNQTRYGPGVAQRVPGS
jgi:hypothetical protein